MNHIYGVFVNTTSDRNKKFINHLLAGVWEGLGNKPNMSASNHLQTASCIETRRHVSRERSNCKQEAM